MENVIVFMICAALTIFGAMTLSNNFLSSVDASTAGLKAMEMRESEIIKTNVALVAASQTAANRLEITINNIGQTKLSDFSRWDVILQYESTSNTTEVKWFPYNETAGQVNEWALEGIFLNGSPEIFEPDIFNTGEEMVLSVLLNPSVKPNSVNMVVVTTPNGVKVSGTFTGYNP